MRCAGCGEEAQMTGAGREGCGIAMNYYPITRQVACPECYQICGWCSWYVKHMRTTGCGCPPAPGATHKRVACEFAESKKGTACSTCDGSGRVSERVELVGKDAASLL